MTDDQFNELEKIRIEESIKEIKQGPPNEDNEEEIVYLNDDIYEFKSKLALVIREYVRYQHLNDYYRDLFRIDLVITSEQVRGTYLQKPLHIILKYGKDPEMLSISIKREISKKMVEEFKEKNSHTGDFNKAKEILDNFINRFYSDLDLSHGISNDNHSITIDVPTRKQHGLPHGYRPSRCTRGGL